MSDTTTMPFQPGTLAAAPEVPDLDESTGNKRVLLVLAALAALAVLLIAGYFLLFAGGSDDKAATAAPATPQTATQPSAAPSTAPKTAVLPKISKKNFGTDPFKALLSDTAAAPAAGAPAAATTTTDSTTTGTTTAPDTTTTGTTAGTTTGTTAPTASKSYHFRVMSVSDGNTTVDVKVDGKSYNGLKAGQVFAKIFKVRFIGGGVNAFQIGDEVFNVSGTKAVNISS